MPGVGGADDGGLAETRPEHVIDEAASLTEAEEKVVERLNPRARAVHAIVKEWGDAELARPTASLLWWGVVAGIAMGLSILTLALLRDHLPDADWAPLVTSPGHATGFPIVILGRQQLFAENTIAVVLPVIAERSWRALGQKGRVRGIVLLVDGIGCVLVAAAFVPVALVPAGVGAAVVDASRHDGELTASTAFVHGIGAGFLIAALAWTMPAAQGSEVLLIAGTAWLIVLGGLTRVIAGMVEIAGLVVAGELRAWDGLATLALQALAGSVGGGTGPFALQAYAQVKDEVRAVEPEDDGPPAGRGLRP